MITRLEIAETTDIAKTFDCGQCFRWNVSEGGAYEGVAFGAPALISQSGCTIEIDSPAGADFWEEYLDLSSKYEPQSEGWGAFEYLAECMDYSKGIRILRQEPWEALCSFIISQCNNITRIKGIVERLCSVCGEKTEYNGKIYSLFPTAGKLASMNAGELAFLRAGYRAPYIINAARAVDSGKIDLERLKNISCTEAKKELLKLEGIGPKVADCAVLFGLHHMEAFPVDVWMKRALAEHFPKDFNPETLGPYAGLAQQYIFYYTREKGKN